VAFCPRSELGSFQCCSEAFHPFNEKHGGFETTFLPQFCEKYFGKRCSDRIQPQIVDTIRLRIYDGVLPELLVVNANHGFVDHDLIRISAADWLYIGLLKPIVMVFREPLTSEL
jgi:hypothetical protein